MQNIKFSKGVKFEELSPFEQKIVKDSITIRTPKNKVVLGEDKYVNKIQEAYLSDEVVKGTGEILVDLTSSGNDRGWASKRSDTTKLADSYKRIGKQRKSEIVRQCTTALLFKECPEGHEKHLVGMYTCKVRLCPVCSWRRSLVVFNQVKSILHELTRRESDDGQKYEYLFLTLTIKNCKGKELKEHIDKLMNAWNRLSKYKEFDSNIHGWFRALEITRNRETDEYHPHFHAILAVKPTYFKKGYIKFERWQELWQRALGVDYLPIINIKRSKENKGKKPVEAVVAEGAKYATKSTDYLLPSKEETDKVVKVLDSALRGRRLVAMGGIFKEIHKLLNLKSEEKADLVHVSDENQHCTCKTCNSNLIEHLYQWVESLKQYIG